MLFLLRHGESTGNTEARLHGSRIGGALTERGHKQAAATAEYLSEAFQELQREKPRIVSSPSARAVQTAEVLSDQFSCPFYVDEGLRELDFGNWSGRRVSELEDDPAYQEWKRDPWVNSPPGGESLAIVRARVWQAVFQLLSHGRRARESLVLVTHFFPLIGLLEILLAGQYVRCENSSISRFRYAEQAWIPTHINDVRHLAKVAPTPVRYV